MNKEALAERLALRKAFGAPPRHLFLRTLLGAPRRLGRLTDAQVEALYTLQASVNTIYDFGEGWETMACVEIAFGESLRGHVSELRDAEAFRLVKNFAGQLTPLVHTERAAQKLRMSPDWQDAFGLISRHGYKLQLPYLLRYLKEAGIESKRITRCDGIYCDVFRVEAAVRYQDSILTGYTRREGKKTGRFPGQRNANKHLMKQVRIHALQDNIDKLREPDNDEA